MIIETLVTTVDAQGRTNLAPMGPHIDPHWETTPEKDPRFELKPFVGSQTQRNLCETGWAVIHFSDDAKLFAETCVGSIDETWIDQSTVPVGGEFPVRRLARCLRYFVVKVDEVLGESPRLTMPCTVVASGVIDPPRGLNRGMLAVIEAAILATRTDVLPAPEIRESIERLKPLVDKTAGEVTASAFNQICLAIDDRLAAASP